MLKETKICFLTTGQPSTNPRLVKEADALVERGYQVHVIYSHWVDWASQTDRELLRNRAWTHSRVGGAPDRERALYWGSRLMHALSRRVYSRGLGGPFAEKRALSRTTLALEAAGKKSKADIYIAHNLGALPAAVAAARKHGTLVGFDAEDFHSAMDPIKKTTPEDKLAAAVEARLLRLCAYVTASSPGIAKAYAQKYGVPQPKTILNVFPLGERPSDFRIGNSCEPLKLYWFSQTIGRDRGLEDALIALGMLQDQTIELHLRGEWCRGYESEFFEIARSAGIARARIHHYRPDRPDRMVELAAQYDIGLALEQRGSFNRDVCITNKIFTHLLAGNAIVATKTRGQQTVIDRIGRAGLCYEPGDAHQLAEGLRRWSEDRQLLAAARHEAWNWGAREYNWDFEKQKFVAIIERVLTQSGCETVATTSVA